jgi:Tol biopolymer transport system component
MSLVVLEESGKELARFAALSMKQLGSSCTQADDIEWIDDNHIAMTCEYNPSLEDYLVVNARTGEVEKEYPGLWFTRSPDHKTVAYVGVIVHFAPPIAQNYCLLFNEKTIYTRHCSNQVDSDGGGPFRNIHTFTYPLVWSPDSRNIAFVEEVFDWDFDPAPNETGSGKSSNERHYLVIASASQPIRGYTLRPSDYSRTPSLAWISTSQIKLDGRIYDLAKDRPGVIP